MVSPSVSLSTILSGGVPYDWRDGVAIVAQLLQQVRADLVTPQTRIPDTDGLALEQNGALTLTIDPSRAAPLMPGAAQLLQRLLGGRDQPPSLRLALLKVVADEPAPRVEQFADELARWERPNRQARLAALHQRAVEHLGYTTDAWDLSKTVPPARPAAAAPRRRQSIASFTRREQTVLGGLAVVVVAAAVWIATGQPIPFVTAEPEAVAQVPVERDASNPAPTPADGVEMPSAEQPAPAIEPGDTPLATAAPAPVARAVAPAARVRDQEPARPANSVVLNTAPPPPPASAGVAPRAAAAAPLAASRGNSLPGGAGVPVAPRDARRPAAAGRALDQPTAITGDLADVGRSMPLDAGLALEYRSGDPGVVPPVPLARLPRKPEPGTPATQLSVLELHVNSDGTVDTARFINSPPSYRNRWWTSAAKSWRFRPALKDGRPVKYVLRLVIQDPGGA